MASYEGFWLEMSIRVVRLYLSVYTFSVIMVAFNAPGLRPGALLLFTCAVSGSEWAGLCKRDSIFSYIFQTATGLDCALSPIWPILSTDNKSESYSRRFATG